MLKTITVASAAILLSSTAFADDKRNLRNASVEDVYVYEEIQTPEYYETCRDVKVPNKSGASGGDVLGGMILGGLLGKGVTGNDDGAAAGAVFGAIISADKNQGPGGHRIERQCETVTEYKTQYRKIYSHSVMRFKENGINRRLEVILPWK